MGGSLSCLCTSQVEHIQAQWSIPARNTFKSNRQKLMTTNLSLSWVCSIKKMFFLEMNRSQRCPSSDQKPNVETENDCLETFQGDIERWPHLELGSVLWCLTFGRGPQTVFHSLRNFFCFQARPFFKKKILVHQKKNWCDDFLSSTSMLDVHLELFRTLIEGIKRRQNVEIRVDGSKTFSNWHSCSFEYNC